MGERVAVPMMINEIKNAKQGDILVFDGKRWVPATFDSIAEKITAKVDEVSKTTQNTLAKVSTKVDGMDKDFNAFVKAILFSVDEHKKAYAVSMAFNKIAMDELLGDSECADFTTLRDWYNQYVSGSTDQLSDDLAFKKYFALFSE